MPVTFYMPTLFSSLMLQTSLVFHQKGSFFFFFQEMQNDFMLSFITPWACGDAQLWDRCMNLDAHKVVLWGPGLLTPVVTVLPRG